MPDRTANDPFTQLARELSRHGPMINNLLAAHPPEGDCRGCRLPGARVPIPAPCSLRSLALLAASIRAGRSTLRSDRGLKGQGPRSARGALAGRGASTEDGR